eukprot:CAMPEP_0119120060 /NCGR_PEP_ID=MMETSP1310-20130426/1273_1 /TAXON_ID=464262 /ORGANISM="Genus nov. species nov., Strain RCC2339" /LENGTH=153 /DNA_ID=CAMNT_0007109523 /DNA_START=56 /DNA_END=517 /DNA_ORIENTATION=-
MAGGRMKFTWAAAAAALLAALLAPHAALGRALQGGLPKEVPAVVPTYDEITATRKNPPIYQPGQYELQTFELQLPSYTWDKDAKMYMKTTQTIPISYPVLVSQGEWVSDTTEYTAPKLSGFELTSVQLSSQLMVDSYEEALAKLQFGFKSGRK